MISRLAALTMRRHRHHILIFHRIMRDVDPMNPGEPTLGWFRRAIKMLSSNFDLISLNEAIKRAERGTLNGRSVSITFDDGYADNYLFAFPVLEEFGIPAAYFVASGFLDGGRMWNDSIIETIRRLDAGVHEFDLPRDGTIELDDWSSRRLAASRVINAWKHMPPHQRQSRVDELSSRVSGLPDDLMMTSTQLRLLANSPQMTIGGHTRNHPILASLCVSGAKDEIESGKCDLEEIVQREIEIFAYPNGKHGSDYVDEHKAIVEAAGFKAALATNWGTMDSSTDLFEIPRFTPWHRNLSRFSIDLARCHHGLI